VRGAGVAIISSLVGCSSTIYTPLPNVSPSSSLIVLVLGEAEVVRALRAFDGSSRPDPIYLELEPGTTQRVLEYDAPLELLVDAAATSALDRTTPLAQAWSLLPPKSYADLEGEAFVAKDPADLTAWLDTFRVPRPPCPRAPTVRVIEQLPDYCSVSFALPWGDGVLMGLNTDGVYRVSAIEARAERIDALRATNGRPVGFLDGERAVVGWGGLANMPTELVSLDRAGNVVGSTITPSLGPNRLLYGLVGRRFGAERTVMGRVFRYSPDDDVLEDIVHLDEATGAWRLVATSSLSEAQRCATARPGHQILELDSMGKGTVGLQGGPIVPFDLTRAPALDRNSPLVPGAAYCRNSRITLADGVQLLAYSAPRDSFGILWRRQDGDPWDDVTSIMRPTGYELASVGNLAVIAGAGTLVGVFEHVPGRPEIPPRQCHEVVTPTGVTIVRSIDARTVFVAGFASALFLDF